VTDVISAGIALILIVWAVSEDVKAFRIPNRLIIAGYISGVIMLVIRGFSGEYIGNYITGTLVGLSEMLIFYIIKAVGAGDVKLFAVLGLLLGKTLITQLLIVSLVTGGITGVVELCIKKTGRVEVGKSHVQMHGFHYAVAILMAYVVVFGYRFVVM
jgi:hypothetical protein